MNRTKAANVLRKWFPEDSAVIEQYLSEAEKRSGTLYWRQFQKDEDALLSDFHVFREALKLPAKEPENDTV